MCSIPNIPARALTILLGLAISAQILAQPAPPPTGPTPAGPRDTDGPNPPDFSRLPPAVRLGLRAEQVRSNVPVIPLVAIARDPASYIRLIAGWGPGGRFPVLYDDGSARTAEHIARFVRAYEPERVIELPPLKGWPDEPAAQRNLIEAALLAAWDVPDEQPRMTALADRFAQLDYRSPGIVIASPTDPAWTAALALAAGRGLPIAWVQPGETSGVSKTMSRAQAGLLAQQIEAGADRSRLLWRGLGDELDAIALCLNVPARVEIEAGKHLALTDVLGRHDGHLAAPGSPAPKRWAWSSQIFGNEAQAAYRAMCSIFLSHRDAWLFDGYPVREPFTNYALQDAAATLRDGGFDVTLFNAPDGNRFTWQTTTSAPIPGGLVMVNTKGAPDRFDLEPGQAWTPDIPHLNHPAMVHFIHSWSAVRPDDTKTIAGMWHARGAFAYFGSVEEPFLQAFVPPTTVAKRLRGGLPWAAATRFDGDSDPWKLASFGDPLLTLARAPARVDIPEGFGAGTITLTDRATEAIEDENYVLAARDLLRAGRDDRVIELARRLLETDRDAFTPELAASVALAAFRERDPELLTSAASVLSESTATALGVTDALWHTAFTHLRRQDDQAMVMVLTKSLRPRTLIRDARELVAAVERHRGPAARSLLIADLVAAAPESRRSELAEALNE